MLRQVVTEHVRSIVDKERVEFDDIQWLKAHRDDLWIFDKLILSRVLGYVCGPVGLDVPRPDFYCIRPITNVLGMGRSSSIQFIEKSTNDLPAGHFWCEVFTGKHHSVDYHNRKQVLCVEGLRGINSDLYKWSKWIRVNHEIEFPEILHDLKGEYEYINCEFIDSKLIEVHFRRNPDFLYHNNEAIPVWNDENIEDIDGYEYISSPDYLRKGFYIR